MNEMFALCLCLTPYLLALLVSVVIMWCRPLVSVLILHGADSMLGYVSVNTSQPTLYKKIYG